MKRNTRIIQISGFKGFLIIVIFASCLVAGFGLFPSYVAMYAWNFAASKLSILPQIGLFQGFLLWAMVAISLYISNERQKYLWSFTPKRRLTEDEVRKLLNRIRLQRTQMMNNQMILKSDNIKPLEKHDNSDEKENI